MGMFFVRIKLLQHQLAVEVQKHCTYYLQDPTKR